MKTFYTLGPFLTADGSTDMLKSVREYDCESDCIMKGQFTLGTSG